MTSISQRPVSVLIVDDSAVVRQVLSTQLSRDPQIRISAAVADPIFAMARMQAQWPDVVLLDVEMPRMDGLTFLRKIMAARPTPVVICSTLTTQGATTTLDALAAGAVSVIAKPKLGVKRYLEDASGDLIAAIKTAAGANISRLLTVPRVPTPARSCSNAPLTPTALRETSERIVALGTSTGGTQALERVLIELPRGCPGIVVVQHMPEKFTAAFAARLNSLCAIEVHEARHGERLLPGHALIAPGGRHLQLRRSGAYYYAEVSDGPLVNRHKPAVDVLFRSVAKCAGANAMGIIMTGMGDDGARGLRAMREAGAKTVAQDEASCVVFGMPKEALRLDAVEHVVSLAAIPEVIMRGQ